jgi:hypothetical protein
MEEEKSQPADGEETKVEEANPSIDEKEMQPETATKKWLNKFKCNCDCSNKKKHIIVGVVLVVLIIAAVGIYNTKFKPVDIGLEGAKTKVTDFVNGNLLPAGTVATVKEAAIDSGMYKITINIAGKQDVVTYLTKDGKKFFPEAMDTDVAKPDAANQKQPEADQPISKTDKPTVDLFVMGFCPFGNQSEDTLKSAYDLLKGKVNFNFHYIVSSSGDTISSLHGPTEVAEDEVEACVLRDFGKDKWFSLVEYVNKNCGKATDAPCWEAGAKTMGILPAKVSSCVTADGVSLMKTNEKAAADAGAQGSPTMLVNGVSTKVVYQYGNSDAYKQVICDAFNKAPVECTKKLSTQTSTTQGGSCGN